jgi:hypothetical protein
MNGPRMTMWQAKALRLAVTETERNQTAPRFCEECGRDLIKERGMAYRCPSGCAKPHRGGKGR